MVHGNIGKTMVFTTMNIVFESKIIKYSLDEQWVKLRYYGWVEASKYSMQPVKKRTFKEWIRTWI